jgi:Rps23 Pro-64 3,4-dihydroxylase Tpa1-like proline 4-hydroxylase
MNFIVSNQQSFQTNLSIHNINTRNKHHLHRSNANLPCFQKSTFYAGIKFLNSLPCGLTILKNEKAKFKLARLYLNTRSFYCVHEFFMCKNDL